MSANNGGAALKFGGPGPGCHFGDSVRQAAASEFLGDSGHVAPLRLIATPYVGQSNTWHAKLLALGIA